VNKGTAARQSAVGLGCVKTPRGLMAIEEVNSSKTVVTVKLARELNFKNGPFAITYVNPADDPSKQ
jgi:hypothetical protein